MRFFIELSYDGTNYAGWQRQPNVETVQGSIEDVLKTLLRKDISVVGCGRTDKGVHAKNYIAHCDLELTLEDTDHLIYKMNKILRKDIACHRFVAVHKDAHARYDAIHRKYIYRIHTSKSPFLGPYSTYLNYGDRISIDDLNDVAQYILEIRDFTSFCKLHGGNMSMECQIFQSSWTLNKDDNSMEYIISANRFLRGMVRLIVGSSLSVATGKLSFSELKNHIKQGTRSPLMQSAPPQGLSLVEIKYSYL